MLELKIELPNRVSGRLSVLDELKGLAILLVILYHAGGVLVWQNFLHGDLGVDIFIILSGIGLALSSREEAVSIFIRRRLIRIMPAYWVVLTLYWLCNTHYLQHHYTTANLLLHYVGMHGWFGDSYAMSINDSFWFITLILTLYLLFCAVRKFSADLGRLLLVGAGFSCAFACVLFATHQAGSFGHLGLRVPGFFLGILIGRILREGRIHLPIEWPLFCAALLFAYVPYVPGIIFFTPLAALALMGGYTFLWKKFTPAAVEVPTSRILTFLGNHSLEIFLIHQPLIREYNYYLHGRWFNIPVPTPSSLIMGIIIGVALTLLLSVELRALVAKILPRENSKA
jgi:peptidoglycan/LPS O-acetylase OafA/YrhL